MPFTGSTFANVSGASNAAAGQIVQSATWNNIHTDYSSAFTQVMSQLVASITDRNIIWMNGGFEIWQRGSSVAVTASATAYTADRWYITTGANQAHTIARQAGLSNNSQWCARIQRDSGQTGTTALVFGYPLDTDSIVRMRGNKVTLSFIASTGANWSPTNGTLVATLYVGTGAVAKRGGGFTGETSVVSISTNIAAGSSATSISGTSSAVLPITATQAEIQFTWTPTGTAGANDWFQVDDLQIENNLTSTTWTPTNFDRISFKKMLEGCKRYYQKTFKYGDSPAAGVGVENCLMAHSQTTATIGLWWQLPIEMRVDPTLTKYHVLTATGSNWYNFTTSATVSATFMTTMSDTKSICVTGVTASGDVQYLLHAAADASI